MAPPGLKFDPDGEAAAAVVDNGIMSPSRMRSGSPRSAASEAGQRAGDAGQDADSVDTTAEDTADTGSGTAVPLPADTVGKAKSGADGAVGQAAEADLSAKPAETSAASAVKGDLKPSFTPSVSAPTSAPAASPSSSAAAAPAPPASATRSASSYQAPSYSDPAPSYQVADYAPPSGYSRPDWQAGGAPSATVQAQPASPSASGNGSSSGAASAVTGAVTGAASGLASSVASAWQRRGSNGQPTGKRAAQVRRPARRQAMLTLARVEPWSVMKFSFVASVVAFIILFVAVAVLYMVLSALGVFDSLQNTVASITSSKASAGTNISHWFSASLILGYTAMLGALNIVLITAISTVGSVVYNLIAKTIGGIEVTLRETD
jgi:hypothetical protein